MLVNIVDAPHALHRVLLLAADSPKLPDLGQLSDTSDVAAMCQAGGLHIDAVVGNVDEDELAQALFTGRYDVFHAAIHGDEDGLGLTAEWLERERLGEMLQVHGIQLAVLLSCESEQVARRVAEAGVCCVVGTTVQLTNDAAYAFCLKFYRHYVKNGDASAAFDYTKRLLRAEYRKEFVFVRGDAPAMDPLTAVNLRLSEIEAKIDETRAAILKNSQEGHREITGAILQMVGLFNGLLGERK